MIKYSFCGNCSLINCPISVPKLKDGESRAVFVINGFPFTSSDYQYINGLMEKEGFDKNQVHFSSVLKCPVMKYKMKENDVYSCMNILSKEIELYNPRFIIGLGPIPLFAFLQQSKGIFSKRGRFYLSEGYFKFSENSTEKEFFNWEKPLLFFPTLSLRNIRADINRARSFWDDFHFISRLLQNPCTWHNKKGKYYIVKDFNMARTTLESLANTSKFSLDIETTGFNEHLDKILGIGFSFEEYTGFYIPLHKKVGDKLIKYWGEGDQELIMMSINETLSSPSIKFIQNYLFEHRFLTEVNKININNPFCTMSYQHLENPSTKESGDTNSAGGGNRDGAKRLSLGTLTSGFMDLTNLKDIWDPFKKKENKGKNLSDLYTTEQIGEYCCQDCDGTFRIGNQQLTEIELKSYKTFFYNRFMPILKFIGHTQSHGIAVDFDYVSEQKIVLEKEANELKEKIQEKVSKYIDKEFNPGSPKQLSDLLFKKMKMPMLDGTSTNADVLDILKVNHGCEIAQDILDYRRVTKIWKTYFVGIEKFINPITRRVHANFKPCGTETGRISITKPALQTLPRKYSKMIKSIFIPTEGMVLFGADYSQIELRLIAWLSQDPVLLDAYAHGRDIHGITGAKLFGISYNELAEALSIDVNDPDPNMQKKRKESKYMRDIGKNANFALCYGGSYNVLINMAGNKLLGPEFTKYDKVDERELADAAKYFRQQYLDLYSGLTPWMERTIAKARKDEYVTSAYGFMRQLPFINSTNSELRARDERKSINTDPQGTASFYLLFRFQDIINEARSQGINCFPLNMVHDALYLESEIGSESVMLNIIETVGVKQDESNITVPMILEPEIGKNMSEV